VVNNFILKIWKLGPGEDGLRTAIHSNAENENVVKVMMALYLTNTVNVLFSCP
jgi:hypothetical protein